VTSKQLETQLFIHTSQLSLPPMAQPSANIPLSSPHQYISNTSPLQKLFIGYKQTPLPPSHGAAKRKYPSPLLPLQKNLFFLNEIIYEIILFNLKNYKNQIRLLRLGTIAFVAIVIVTIANWKFCNKLSMKQELTRVDP